MILQKYQIKQNKKIYPKIKDNSIFLTWKRKWNVVGIKPEQIEIIEEQTKEEKNAIIGIYNKSLTKRGEYQALIGMDLY